MACDTCDHTMHNIGMPGFSMWWCPRCGTLKSAFSVSAPKLVGRIIEFSGSLTEPEQWVIDEFERLGIRESITAD